MKHAISRASVGRERRLSVVSAARQHLGIAAGRSDRASFQRAALEHGQVELSSNRRVATQNPAGEVSIMPPFSLLEKERNRYYLVLVSRNWFKLVLVSDPTNPTKWTCAQTSDQGGFGSDQQGDVAAPLRSPGAGLWHLLLIQNEKIKTLFWTVMTLG